MIHATLRTVCLLSLTACVLLCATSVVTQAQPLTPEIIDHTPAAEARDVPEVLADLSLPEGALERLTEVHASEDGVRSVQVAWLSGDRYLWRVELDEELPEGRYLTLYLDADADEETGSPDERGADLRAQVGPGHERVTQWMADGALTANRGMRSAIDGSILWATIDCRIPVQDARAHFAFRIASPRGGVGRIEASIPAEGPRALSFDADGREVGGGLTLQIDGPHQVGERQATSITVTNTGDSQRWIALSLPRALDLDGPIRWFDGFSFTPHDAGAAALEYHGTSAVLPLTCAWDGSRGVALAFDPIDWYTEAHTLLRPVAEGHEIILGSRLALMPGESHSFTFNLFSFDGGLGWRGAFDAYWRFFPEVYERARDIDPRFHQASGGGLYRNWRDPAADEFCADLIRRMRAHWEWGYAPAPRPGEWAVSEKSIGEWTRSAGTVPRSMTAEDLPDARARIREWVHDTANLADVAVAYYMHLKYVEKGLMEQYFSDSYFREEQIEYVGYYQRTPCWSAYPWANSYGDYLRDSIPSVVDSFGPAGVAFDSVFGFIPHWGRSADLSPATSFANGRAFVGEGIGFAKQMDVVREQRSGDFRTAMVTNLKLPTLSANAVRTDTALLEFHPMGNPGHRERILRLRMLSGQIMFNWWHHYAPDHYRWIPWDELSAEQTLNAFRRLRDDILIHSLYYGGVPCGRFAVGVPKVMEAIPMLIEIADVGWQPVIAAAPVASDLLISRYGSGLGMGFGAGNQGYEPITDELAIDRAYAAGGDDAAFLAWTGERTVTSFADREMRLQVSVPHRDVRAWRAVMLMPAGSALQAAISADLREYEPSTMTVELECAEAGEFPVTIWLPGGALEPTVEPAATVTAVERAEDGSLRATLSLQAGANLLTVSWRPSVALQGDRDTLLDYPFVTDGAPNCNVVAAGDTQTLAFRVRQYFREYHRWALDEPANVMLPIVTPEQAPEGRRIVVGLLDDLPADVDVTPGDASAAFGVSGELVYATARTPEMLERAVKGLLFTLDERYEWWGPYYPTQHFFRGDPANSPEALREAGMAGKYLTGDDTGTLREVIELPDLIEW